MANLEKKTKKELIEIITRKDSVEINIKSQLEKKENEVNKLNDTVKKLQRDLTESNKLYNDEVKKFNAKSGICDCQKTTITTQEEKIDSLNHKLHRTYMISGIAGLIALAIITVLVVF